MIRFTCESCGKRLKAPESAIEGNARCPRCGVRFPVIPDPILPFDGPVDALEIEYTPELQPPQDTHEPQWESIRHRPKTDWILFADGLHDIGQGLVSLAAMIVCLIFMYFAASIFFG